MEQNGKGLRAGFIIMRKEFFEIFRDRRTVMSVVVSPLLITPALFALMGVLINTQTEKARTQTYHVGIVGSESAPKTMAEIGTLPNFRFDPVPKEEVETQIKNRTYSAAIVLPPDADARLATGVSIPITLLEDVGAQNSQSAAGRLDSALNAVGQKLAARRLKAQHLPPDFATPFKTTETPIKQGGSMGTFLLAMLLPYSLVVAAFGGAIYAAFDQVAGEKERGTLETLLVSPASRRDIVLGKFGAVVAVCLISSVLSIVGLVIAFSSRSKAFEWLAKGGLHLSPAALGVTLLVMLPISVLFAGLLLAVSTFARNQKEAQTYLAPLFIVVLMPAMSSMFIGTDVGQTVALVPVLNASIIIKQALSGSYDAGFIALAFAASAAYAAVALAFATRLFQKESVLIKA